MVKINEHEIRKRLAVQEGTKLHKLKHEKFITSAYGLAYKYNRDANIFHFYKYIGKILKFPTRSLDKWNLDFIDEVNDYIEKNNLKMYEWSLIWETINKKYVRKLLFSYSKSEWLSYAIFQLDYNCGHGTLILQRLINRHGGTLIPDNIFGIHTALELEELGHTISKKDLKRECEAYYNKNKKDKYLKSHIRICELITV